MTDTKVIGADTETHYLGLLSKLFPTVAEASTEIINLEAIMHLPKGTEHFLADIHGESEAFQHVLKNASGNIKRKVNELFGNSLRESEKKELCTLIYYPEQKIELVKAVEPELADWYHITIHQLVRVCRDVSSKYTRSKVRKSLPADFSYIIEELLHESADDSNKAAYVNVIVDTIITTGRADDFIIALCNVIQRLAIDQLHILGDIYDRGPGAHIIMDFMQDYHSWDLQWGNHDILWLGAVAGNDACICNVLRLSLRYANLATLEEGYGINLVPLATFAGIGASWRGSCHPMSATVHIQRPPMRLSTRFAHRCVRPIVRYALSSNVVALTNMPMSLCGTTGRKRSRSSGPRWLRTWSCISCANVSSRCRHSPVTRRCSMAVVWRPRMTSVHMHTSQHDDIARERLCSEVMPSARHRTIWYDTGSFDNSMWMMPSSLTTPRAISCPPSLFMMPPCRPRIRPHRRPAPMLTASPQHKNNHPARMRGENVDKWRTGVPDQSFRWAFTATPQRWKLLRSTYPVEAMARRNAPMKFVVPSA